MDSVVNYVKNLFGFGPKTTNVNQPFSNIPFVSSFVPVREGIMLGTTDQITSVAPFPIPEENLKNIQDNLFNSRRYLDKPARQAFVPGNQQTAFYNYQMFDTSSDQEHNGCLGYFNTNPASERMSTASLAQVDNIFRYNQVLTDDVINKINSELEGIDCSPEIKIFNDSNVQSRLKKSIRQ